MAAETSFPLMTSESVNTPEEAYEYVGYYIQRWKTGRFHYVLKSGRAIEKPRERSIKEEYNAYHDVLNNCGYDYEHDLCGAAEAGCALSAAFRGRGRETAVLRNGQD